MFNPAGIMKIKSAWNTFTCNHPKFPMFMQAVAQKGVTEGTIIEIHVKRPDGEDICTNVKVQQSDLDLFESLKSIR